MDVSEFLMSLFVSSSSDHDKLTSNVTRHCETSNGNLIIEDVHEDELSRYTCQLLTLRTKEPTNIN